MPSRESRAAVIAWALSIFAHTANCVCQLSLGWWSVEQLELRGSNIISVARIVNPTLVLSYTRRSDHRNVHCPNQMRHQSTTNVMETAVVGLKDQDQAKTRYHSSSLWVHIRI